MNGNKGEWSELYTLFKLLAEGRLYAADENANKLEDVYYDVLKVIRSQTNGAWEYIRNGSVRVVQAETGELIADLPILKFVEQSDSLLEKIRSGNQNTGSFSIPEVWTFAEEIGCNTLKAKSTDKSDITLMVHDLHTGRDPLFGFSIKSQMGSASTLLNASAATNISYKIINHFFSNEEKLAFNGIRLFRDKLKYLEEYGAELVFNKIENNKFDFNLKLVDTQMPKIIADVVQEFYKGSAISIQDLTRIVAEGNCLEIDPQNTETFYAYKVKELLTNIALGMVPSTIWGGTYDATGGYIIVKEDGDLLCYHIYNRNEFREYLFQNTKLETPSTSKHQFGTILNSEDGQILKLNLQIRFIK